MCVQFPLIFKEMVDFIAAWMLCYILVYIFHRSDLDKKP